MSRLWLKRIATRTPPSVASTKAINVTRKVVHKALISTAKFATKAAKMSDGAASTSGEIPLSRTRHSQSARAAMPTVAGTMYFSAAFMVLPLLSVARKRAQARFFVLQNCDGVRMGRRQVATQSGQARAGFRRCRAARLDERADR